MFSKAERNIYKYWNGSKDVYADPMLINKKLQECYPEASNPKSDWEIIQLAVDAKETVNAYLRMTKFARDVFGLPSLDEDGNGVTELECLHTLVGFTTWQEDLKNDFFGSPTSPPATGSESSSSATNPATTEPSSDSHSTSSEQITATV